MEEYYGTGMPSYKPPVYQSNKFKIRLIIVLCILAVVVAGIVIFSAVGKRQHTVALSVTVSDPTASITVNQAGKKSKDGGTGNVTLRVAPGKYTINAKTTKGEASKPVDVLDNQDNRVDITIQDAQTPKALAEYTAQDIFVVGSKLFFLNTPFQTMNSFTPGDYRTDPVFPDAYPALSVHWLNDHQIYYQNQNNDWFFDDASGGAIKVASGTQMIDPSAISFNKTGAFAYVAKDKSVVIADAPASKPKVLTKGVGDARVSLADNGDVAIYTPKQTFATEIKGSQLYDKAKNQLTPLSDSLKGVDNVTWSPDSKAFAYTQSDGIHTYLLDGGQSSQVTSVAPDHPLSLVWGSGTRLLYAQGTAIWDYQTGEQSSNKIAEIAGGLDSAQPFYISPDGKTAYYGTIPQSGSGGNIYSFNL